MAPATSRSASSSRSSSSAKAGPSSSSSKPAPQRSSSALRLSNAPPPPPPAAKQGKLAFTRLPGPVPSPPKKKVRIHAPEKDAREAKGKGKASASGFEDEDDADAADLWSSQYRPTSRAQLAIHPRKIDDVEQWLREAFSASPWLRNRRRILLLRGPAGAAKTETIRQLSAATELDFEVLEWKTSEAAAGGGAGPSDWREGLNEGIMDRFREFISKSAKFPTLALATQDGRRASSPTSSTGSSSTSRTRRQVILLEDLPTLSHYPTLQAFHDIIATFLSQPPRSVGGNVPLVIILSDTASSTSGSDGNDGGSLEDRSSDDAWMRTRKLLGEEAVAMSDRWHEIKFNPVAITILTRVLKETYERAIGYPLPAPIKSKSKPAPLSHKAMPVEVVETLAESSLGDVRSAIDLLQQAHQRFVKKPRRFEKVAQSRTKTKAKEEARKLMVELGLMSRESALDLFHALGKLMFNKRVGDPAEKRRRGEEEVESDEDEEDDEEGVKMGERKKRLLPLPKHLAHLERRKSKVNVEYLASSGSGVDASLLQLWAHHNYPNSTTDIEQCALISDAYSYVECDLIPASDRFSGYNAQQPLLLSHYATLVSFGATLLHLPSPVPRKGQKMNKPGLWDCMERARGVRGDAEALQDEARRGGGAASSSALGMATATPQQVAAEWAPMLATIAGAGGSSTGWDSKQRNLLKRVGGMDWQKAFASSGQPAAVGAHSRSFDEDDVGDLAELVEEDEGGEAVGSGSQDLATKTTLFAGGGDEEDEGGELSDDPIEED